MAIVEAVLTGLAAAGIWDGAKISAAAAYEAVLGERPDLIEKADAAAASGNDEALREALSGVIEVLASSGTVDIDGGAVIAATRQATFDHQTGRVNIAGATIAAPVLKTGGGVGATGETNIGGGTSLRSAGTAIDVGHGASIRITGGASIKQT